MRNLLISPLEDELFVRLINMLFIPTLNEAIPRPVYNPVEKFFPSTFFLPFLWEKEYKK